jgi:SAM-dependent methyltransferase
MTESEKKSLFHEILAYTSWRQRVPLGEPGVATSGYLSIPNEWEYNHIQSSLIGKSFLDVGSNDGYFCFEAEKRGATEILGVDLYHDGGNSNRAGWSIKGVSLLKNFLDAKAEFKSHSIYELDKLNRKFDVVLCASVIAWLDNPNEAIKQLSEICTDTLYLKDGFLTKYNPEPVLLYEKPRDLVTFRPNLSYMKAILQSHGFKTIEFKPVFHFKFFEWQNQAFPAVANSSELEVFETPFFDSPIKEVKVLTNKWVLTHYDGYSFIRGAGWVKTETLQTKQRMPHSWKNALLKKLLPDNMMNDFTRIRGKEPYVKSYMIIAKK